MESIPLDALDRISFELALLIAVIGVYVALKAGCLIANRLGEFRSSRKSPGLGCIDSERG
jgi:hypothetical protein